MISNFNIYNIISLITFILAGFIFIVKDQVFYTGLTWFYCAFISACCLLLYNFHEAFENYRQTRKYLGKIFLGTLIINVIISLTIAIVNKDKLNVESRYLVTIASLVSLRWTEHYVSTNNQFYQQDDETEYVLYAPIAEI